MKKARDWIGAIDIASALHPSAGPVHQPSRFLATGGRMRVYSSTGRAIVERVSSNLVLAEVGLSAEEIRTALRAHGCAPARAADSEPRAVPRYVCGDQKRVWARVRQSEPSFFALALMGYNAATIGAVMGVSDECVLRRLRPVGLAKPRGRPRLKTPCTGEASRKPPPKSYIARYATDSRAA